MFCPYRTFLKEPGGIDSYENIEIEWIFHREAELTIYDDSKEGEEEQILEIVKLYPLRTQEEMHALVKSKVSCSKR